MVTHTEIEKPGPCVRALKTVLRTDFRAREMDVRVTKKHQNLAFC